MNRLHGRGLRRKALTAIRRGDPDGSRRRLRAFRAGVPTSAVAATSRPERFEQTVEIVVPCYNHGAFLGEAFASIEAQTWRDEPLTVTLIDDNSTDGSLDVMRTLAAAADPDRLQVRLIVNERTLYQAGSLNRAIATSQNKLFVILNADDILTPDSLETIVGTYRRVPEIFMLGGSSLWFADANDLPPHRAVPVESLRVRVTSPSDVRNYSKLNDLNMSQSSCSCLRAAWSAVDGYAPPKQRVCGCDDRDFQFRIAALFPVGVYDDYPLTYYRTSSSQGRWAL